MIQPLNNNVLVKPFKGSNVTDGGLIIPDNLIKDTDKVEVVRVSNKVTSLKKGTIGYRVKEWGTPIQENGETYFLMDAKAIIALE